MAETLPIGEYLVRKELISPRALAQVLKDQPVKRQRLISMLILRAELEIDDGATCLSEQMGYTAAFERHLERRDVSAAKLLPSALCAQYAVIAIGKTAGGRLIVGARDPSPALQAELERATQLTIELAVVPAILVERLVRATFSLAIETAVVFPAGKGSTHRARSVSALYADTQPPKVFDLDPPTVIPAPRQSTSKIVIPERKPGQVVAGSDVESGPILLDRPKRPTGTQEAVAPVRTLAEKTQPGLPAQRAPAAAAPIAAARPPTHPPPLPPALPKVRPPTPPPAPPSMAARPVAQPLAARPSQPAVPGKPRPPTQPPAPPRSQFEEITRPAAAALRGEEITRPAIPIAPGPDPQTGAPPRMVAEGTGAPPRTAAEGSGASRQQTPTAPAPNQAVPEDARPPDRRQGPTRPTPNLPIPDEARPPTPAPGSIAIADLEAEVTLPLGRPAPSQLADRPADRPRTVSEMFGDLMDDPPTPPPVAIAPPLPTPPVAPAPKPRPATEQPASRVSAPALPPPPSIPTPRPPTEPTVVSGPPKPPAAPGTGSIDAVCKEIERAISRATADRVLITFAGSRFRAALLVMIAEGVARGARGQGPRLQAVQTVVLPIEAPSIIQVAHDTRELTRVSPASPTQDRIAELLGSTEPLAVPVIVDDTVVAVLAVGDALEFRVADEELLKVVLAFATAYKRLYKAK